MRDERTLTFMVLPNKSPLFCWCSTSMLAFLLLLSPFFPLPTEKEEGCLSLTNLASNDSKGLNFFILLPIINKILISKFSKLVGWPMYFQYT